MANTLAKYFAEVWLVSNSGDSTLKEVIDLGQYKSDLDAYEKLKALDVPVVAQIKMQKYPETCNVTTENYKQFAATAVEDCEGENVDLTRVIQTLQNAQAARRKNAQAARQNAQAARQNAQVATNNGQNKTAAGGKRCPKKTPNKVKIGGRDHCIYEGVRGGKYIKVGGEFKSLSSIRNN